MLLEPGFPIHTIIQTTYSQTVLVSRKMIHITVLENSICQSNLQPEQTFIKLHHDKRLSEFCTDVHFKLTFHCRNQLCLWAAYFSISTGKYTSIYFQLPTHSDEFLRFCRDIFCCLYLNRVEGFNVVRRGLNWNKYG